MAESLVERGEKIGWCQWMLSVSLSYYGTEGQAGGETTQTDLHCLVNLAQLIPVSLVRQLPMHLA